MPSSKKRKESRKAKGLMSSLVLDTDAMDKMKRSPKKIAEAHIRFYKYYITFATNCEALSFEEKNRTFFEHCVHYLENKPLTKMALIKSKDTIMKIFDSLMELCKYLGTDMAMVLKARQVYEISDSEMPEKELPSEQGGSLDQIKHSKDLLNDPVEVPKTVQTSAKNRTTSMKDLLRAGHLSPTSDRSSLPILNEDESDEQPHKIQSMTECLLSDPKHHSPKSTYSVDRELSLLEMNRNLANISGVCPEEVKRKDFDIDLFHCGVPNCKFSTNDPTTAYCHYSLTTNGFRIQRCEYCVFTTLSIHSYCKHVFEMHGFSKYKCGYCSYRTVSKANAIFHQRDVHEGEEHKIYGIEPVQNASYNYDCLSHICLLPFVCDVCNFGTMAEKKFTRHLEGHRGMCFSCYYCSTFFSDDISELYEHFVTHGISKYHCLYCKEALEANFLMQRHLYEKHPGKYPYQIVLQDFYTQSRFMKDKYRNVQKLDISNESVIVLQLDSDYEVESVSIIDCSKVVFVEEVDHCKAQLTYFLKNTYKELPLECEPPCEPNPTLLDSLEITIDEKPVDVKPEIRDEPLNSLMNQPGNGSSGAPAVVKKLVEERVTGNPEPPLQTTEPVLTSAQIKIEQLETTPPAVHNDQFSDNVQPEKTAETVTLSSVHNEMSLPLNVVIKTERYTDVNTSSPEGLTAVYPLNDTIEQSASHDASHIVIHSSFSLQDEEIENYTITQDGNRAISNENTLLPASAIVNMPAHFDCETDTLNGIQVLGNAAGHSEQYFILDDDGLLNYPSTRPEIRQETSSTLTTVAATRPPSFKTDPVTVAPTSSTGSRIVSKQNRGIQKKSVPAFYRCTICNVKATRKTDVITHLWHAHSPLILGVTGKQNVASAAAATPMSTLSHSVDESIPCNYVGCPYCPGMKFQGIKSYNRHHEEEHGDYNEVKCFIDYPANLKPVPKRVLACNFCDAFFVYESMFWAHSRSAHKEQLACMEKPIRLNVIMGLGKLVCPIYTCSEEFMQVSVYKEHFFSMHPTIVSCNRCICSVDNTKDFQSFHSNMDPNEAVNHFSYFRNEAQKAELLQSKRYKDQIYCLVKAELVSGPTIKATRLVKRLVH